MSRGTPDSIRLHPTAPEPAREAAPVELAAEEMASILSSLPGTVLVISREQKIVSCTGRRGSVEVLGKSLFDLLPEPHHAFYQQQLKRVLDGGETVVFDVEGRADGAEVDRGRVSVRLAPLAIGEEIRGVISFNMEIEHELSVRRLAARIRATLDHVDEGLLVVDLTAGSVIECNEAAARLLRVPAEELRDTAPSWLQVAPEGSARLGWGALLDELVEGRSIRGTYILREGQEVSLELRATSRNLDDGVFAFVLCRDIAADLARERARANQERLATVGSLAAGVAHEINNPLAYVIANVQYALDAINQWQTREVEPGVEADRRRAQVKEALHEANEGARRVQRIVADLKALARQGEDRVEPINVENTLQWAIGVTMAEVRHRALLRKNFQAMPPVRGDEARLGQVFVNILLNAAQAIEPGRPQDNEIVVNAFSKDGRVLVEVLDTGSGIREENLKRIFDPFFTTKPRGIGTGLGLSICHEIIASMRGGLTAENRPSGGAKFVVDLPAMPPQVARPQPARMPPAAKPTQRARILIIDDEALAAKALARILREHQVEISDHARTGLQLALENRFDVIFCDLMMPELTGMAVHEAVARESPAAAERMLFVTGGTFTEEARAFAARHAARCLFKPFDLAHVKGAIERLLSEKGAVQSDSC